MRYRTRIRPPNGRLSHIFGILFQAAGEQNRFVSLHLEPQRKIWTKAALHRLLSRELRDAHFIAVSNREPLHPNACNEWKPSAGL